MNGWDVAIHHDDMLRRTFRIIVWRPRGDGRDEVMVEDGTFITVAEGEYPSDHKAGVAFPAEVLEKLAERLHPYAGHKVEIARLEEALRVERERVDRVITKATS